MCPNYFNGVRAEYKCKKSIAAEGDRACDSISSALLKGAKITLKEFVFKFLLASIIHAI